MRAMHSSRETETKFPLLDNLNELEKSNAKAKSL
jgi:hypothetical protein